MNFDNMNLDNVIIRKLAGTDCTEEESAEIKQVIKSHLINGVLPVYFGALFPLETGEVLDELEK